MHMRKSDTWTNLGRIEGYLELDFHTFRSGSHTSGGGGFLPVFKFFTNKSIRHNSFLDTSSALKHLHLDPIIGIQNKRYDKYSTALPTPR